MQRLVSENVAILCDNMGSYLTKGVIHKPYGQLRGRGVSQMMFLLNKPYLVNVTTKGRGVKNTHNFDHMVYGWPLTTLLSIDAFMLIVDKDLHNEHDKHSRFFQ